MLKRLSILVLTVILAMTFATGVAFAADQSHLHSVLEKGVLRVAMIPDNPGWSVMGSDGTWVGYDVEVAKLFAEALGVQLELIPTEGGNRVTMIQTDKADVCISSFTPTLERAKVITFSSPYAAAGTLPLCRKDNMLTSWDDLKDKKISCARGSTNDTLATKEFPDAEIVRFDSIADAFIALKTGKVDVLLEDDSQVYALAADNADTAPMDVPLKNPAYAAFGVPQGDHIWLEYVNRFIVNNMYSGVFHQLWRDSFGREMFELYSY
jgi:polar amino acid transport system substrate-binding protein